MARPENGFLSFNSSEITRAQLNITLGIPESIPPMSSRGAAEQREIEAVDEVRRDRIGYLVKLADTQARWGKDPTEIVERTLPHVDLVWGTFSALEYYLQFAKIQHGFGNDARSLWNKAAQIAFGIEHTGFAAKAYADIASSKASVGLNDEADGDFHTAIGLIQADQDEIEDDDSIGKVSASTIVKRVAYRMLNCQRVDMAREAIKVVKDDMLREMMEEELKDKIAEAEFAQRKGLLIPLLSDTNYHT